METKFNTPKQVKPRFKLYRHVNDEESGEWYRSLLGYVRADNENEAMAEGVKTYGLQWREMRVYPVGVRVKLSGYMTAETQGRLLRESFNSMGRDEQDAYMGR